MRDFVPLVETILKIPVYFVATLLICGHDTDKILTCERHGVGRETKTGETKMTAQEFVNSIKFPCFFFAGNGAPAGQTIAILPETELPVDLDEVTGGTTATGVFECDNYTDGKGINDWKFSDERGNTIVKIQIFSSKEIWEREYAEWIGE
jgi:hypothetical protein